VSCARLPVASWFDIPVVYNNNRRAVLAMEKGTPGERVFAGLGAVTRKTTATNILHFPPLCFLCFIPLP
jgi:hypothetical protein